MPTYEYICGNCGCEFEHFQSITARPLCKCPRCGKRRLKRLIGSGSGVIFKGSGFYETDYRSEGYKKAEKSEKSTSDTTTKGENKTEIKDSKPSEKSKSSPSDKKKSE